MAERVIMRTKLHSLLSPAVQGVRPFSPADRHGLGTLLFEAYLGTIDQAEGTLEQAHTEIDKTIEGEYGTFLPGSSMVVERLGVLHSAALLTRFRGRHSSPFPLPARSARTGAWLALASRARSAPCGWRAGAASRVPLQTLLPFISTVLRLEASVTPNSHSADILRQAAPAGSRCRGDGSVPAVHPRTAAADALAANGLPSRAACHATRLADDAFLAAAARRAAEGSFLASGVPFASASAPLGDGGPRRALSEQEVEDLASTTPYLRRTTRRPRQPGGPRAVRSPAMCELPWCGASGHERWRLSARW